MGQGGGDGHGLRVGTRTESWKELGSTGWRLLLLEQRFTAFFQRSAEKGSSARVAGHTRVVMFL